MKFKNFISKGLIYSFGIASLLNATNVNAIPDSNFSNRAEFIDNKVLNENNSKKEQENQTLEKFLDSNEDYEIVDKNRLGPNGEQAVCFVAKKDETKACRNIADKDSERSFGLKPTSSFYDEENKMFVIISTPNALTDEESWLI